MSTLAELLAIRRRRIREAVVSETERTNDFDPHYLARIAEIIRQADDELTDDLAQFDASRRERPEWGGYAERS